MACEDSEREAVSSLGTIAEQKVGGLAFGLSHLV